MQSSGVGLLNYRENKNGTPIRHHKTETEPFDGSHMDRSGREYVAPQPPRLKVLSAEQKRQIEDSNLKEVAA